MSNGFKTYNLSLIDRKKIMNGIKLKINYEVKDESFHKS